MKKVFLLGCLMGITTLGRAQTVRPWEENVERKGLWEDMKEGQWEESYDEWETMASHKLDLNRCTREDLERLPFLSYQQIMDLIEYRDRAGRIESRAELSLIPSLEKRDAEMLWQFVTILPEVVRDTLPSWHNLWKYARHELVGAAKVPFYQRRGDKNGYLGYPYKHWLRYTLTSGQHVKAGLVASQDAGEPFMAGHNAKGYDFYSFYLMLRNVGRIKALVVGRYRLRMGMGLVMNGSFGLGKLNTLSTLGRSETHIVAHSSRSEANYLQGTAATLTLARGLDLTGFVSWRQRDATLHGEDGTVSTLLTTGYHRTEREMERRHNTEQTLVGGRVNYFNRGFHIGATGLFTSFSRELRPDTRRDFRRWYPAGKQFANASIDYGYLSNRLTVSGETAIGSSGTLATINSVSYLLKPSLSVMALQRYYPYQYVAVMGRSFAEGGRVNNESGVYLGAQWAPVKGLRLMGYSDIAYFAWPRYQVSQSSFCRDHLAQAAYEHGRWDFLARYRYKWQQRDNADHSALISGSLQRLRLSAEYANDRWSSKTQADFAHSSMARQSTGYMLTQQLSWHQSWLQLLATVGYFHTDDYASRVYVYERGLLYDFSFPSFYGHGLRYALWGRARIGSKVTLVTKLSTTHYLDRATIGSGLQQIDGSAMTDCEIQLKVKL